MTERRRSNPAPTFEEATSPLYRSNDGRLVIEPVPPADGQAVVDTADGHVELSTRRQEIADAFVAGYDYHERVSRDET